MNDENYLRTKDLGLTAGLTCSGYNVESVDNSDPKRVVFVIKRDKDLDGYVSSYFNHNLKVDALGYFYALKELKNRIYNI